MHVLVFFDSLLVPDHLASETAVDRTGELVRAALNACPVFFRKAKPIRQEHSWDDVALFCMDTRAVLGHLLCFLSASLCPMS